MCGPACQCSGCKNNEDFLEERKAAIAETLSRDIDAFKDKVDQNAKTHSKGCKCDKSYC